MNITVVIYMNGNPECRRHRTTFRRPELDRTGSQENLRRANSLLEQYGATAMRLAMMLGGGSTNH
jgi:hypothetical protein